MKLPRYDVTITISDPADPETKVSAVIGGAEREALLERKIFDFGALLRTFEEMVQDEDEWLAEPANSKSVVGPSASSAVKPGGAA